MYSDSLAALTTLKGWAGWGVARRLKCEDRAEVRAVLWKAAEGRMQRLEKVKAHRTDVAAKADPKALWNEKADAAAGRAADSGGVGTATCEELHEFEDVVQVRDGGGRWLRVVGKEVEECWWEKQKGAVVTRRPETLGKMFPPGVKIWWKVSNRMFGRPVVKGDAWIEAAAPGVVKWVARARVGALATEERLSKTGTVKGPDGQPAEIKCQCCGAAVENDVHILTGCPETGTDKVADEVQKVWREALVKAKKRERVWQAKVVDVGPPALEWFRKHALLWAAALIPLEAREVLGQPMAVAVGVLSEVSLEMGKWLQERMRDREAMLDLAEAARGGNRKEQIKAKTRQVQDSYREEGQLGLTEAEARAVARGEVEVRWMERRPSLTERIMVKKKREADLEGWVRRHFPAERVLKDGKDPAAASAHSLLVMWEAERGLYPSTADTFTQTVAAFSRDLSQLLRGMGRPYCEAKTARVRRLVASGAGYAWLHTRFPLKIKDPSSEFVERWKDFVRWVAKGQVERTHGAGGSARAWRSGRPRGERKAGEKEDVGGNAEDDDEDDGGQEVDAEAVTSAASSSDLNESSGSGEGSGTESEEVALPGGDGACGAGLL